MKKFLGNVLPFLIVGIIVASYGYWQLFSDYRVLKEGREAFEEQDYKEVINSFSQVKEELSIEDKFILATSYRQTNNKDVSLQIYQEIIRDESISIDKKIKTLINAGNIYADKGQVELALESYSAVLQLSEEKNEMYYHAIHSASSIISASPNEDNIDKGINYYEILIEQDPDDLDSLFRLAMLYKIKEENEKSMGILIDIIDKNAAYTDAYIELGFFYVYKEDFKKAIHTFEQGINYKPNEDRLYEGLGIAYEYSNQFDRAIHHYHQSISYNNKNVASRFGLARIYLKKKDNFGASNELTSVIQMAPKSIYADKAREILEDIAPKVYAPSN